MSILEGLKGSKKDRDNAIRSLVRNAAVRAKIVAFVKSNRGDADDAQMIFTDAILSLAKTVFKNPNFTVERGVENYLFGIARYMWYGELRKRRKGAFITNDQEGTVHTEVTAEELMIKSERFEGLSIILDKMKIKCKEVIMYWANGYKMKEISKMLGYKSEGVARKKKSECMKELLLYLDNNPALKNALRK